MSRALTVSKGEALLCAAAINHGKGNSGDSDPLPSQGCYSASKRSSVGMCVPLFAPGGCNNFPFHKRSQRSFPLP